ncbi:MAG: YiiD C-terminal domain-containing protein [Planctomycetes bacterium]|nr:YiiD C-terminal domain-containing protein [Planctomycetota bacterium]
MTPAELEAYIHENLPITKAMDVRVADLDDRLIRLRAPLAPNINHKRTVFGGSINSLAIVCAWSVAYVILKRAGHAGEIVIRHSETKFLKPANGAFEAACRFPEGDEIGTFLHKLQRRNLAGLTLKTTVRAQEQVCAEFAGEFVAVGP